MKASELFSTERRLFVLVSFILLAAAAYFLGHTARSNTRFLLGPRVLLEPRLLLEFQHPPLVALRPESEPVPETPPFSGNVDLPEAPLATDAPLPIAHCPIEAPPQNIGARAWQTVEEDVIPRGNEVWGRAGVLFDRWNNGSLQLDEEKFYGDRPELLGHTGGGEPGFAWFKHLTNLDDSKPVEFASRPPPSSVQLPRCDVAKMHPEERLGGVSVCAMVRNEEQALAQWLNYYYYLGVSKVVLYDDGSTDGTAEVAAAYSGFVDYVKWEKEPGRNWETDQVIIYYTCIERELARGAKWVGPLDVDEYVVFDDPNERLDSFLDGFAGGRPNVGSVSFTWRMMHSDAISLPDPAFALLDVRYACKDGGDDWHHVKTFVRAGAFERTQHPHYVILKDGFHQFDVSGGIIDPPGPFASRSIHSPARLNHYRLLSLHEWLRKASKRHSRKLEGGEPSAGHATKSGDYSLEHLEATLGKCFPVQPDASALLNVLARQGCL
ncbi:hypothetical protein KFL_001860210 [Klebsormidium nitens]|uniref:Glycosyltransferase family 92 protein n=1 Tax=Klebsormidium nitens TaxID=105231 RepID=A0A1Y1I0D2_KLENI|nr:hypothetical protein KFL_001860210 [Klebsormidium nitens]|eukprot:GAQ84374.1 hypothetical protein KFL_001860210 [Klebsormidium nitens]